MAGLSDAPMKGSAEESLFIRPGATNVPGLPLSALEIRYYHEDHLCSSSVLTDGSGSLCQEAANYAFGYPRSRYQPSFSFEPYAYTQKEFDTETGFLNFEVRLMAAVVGRFSRLDLLASRPPQRWLGMPQSLNLYAYAAGNPIRYIDPSGCEKEESNQSYAEGNFTSPSGDRVTFLGGWHDRDSRGVAGLTGTLQYNAGEVEAKARAFIEEAKQGKVGGLLITHSYGNIVYEVAKQIMKKENNADLDEYFTGRIGIGSPIAISKHPQFSLNLIGWNVSKVNGLPSMDLVPAARTPTGCALNFNVCLYGIRAPGETDAPNQMIYMAGVRPLTPGLSLSLHSAKEYLNAMASEGLLKRKESE
jgi:RHS repeat-associated protein